MDHSERPNVSIGFDEAKSRLMPRVYGEIPFAILRSELEARGAVDALPATGRMAGEVLLAAAVDTGDSWLPVTEQLAAGWGVGVKEVWRAAIEAARQRLDVVTATIKKGTYRIHHQAFAAVLLTNRAAIGELRVKGSPVIVIPTDHDVFVTGTDDLEGLALIARAAERLVLEQPDSLVSAQPLIWRDSDLQVFDWPMPSARRRWGRRADPATESIGAQLERQFADACHRRQAAVATMATKPPTIDDLAACVLNAEGRRVFTQARADHAELDEDEFDQRYPDLGQALIDEGPVDIALLIGAGQHPYPWTIGWCDWAGEDEPGQVRDFVDTACRNLGLRPPAWDQETEDRVLADLGSDAKRGDYPRALLRDVDAQLRTVGLRLLMIEQETDMYRFAPVTAADFERLAGATGDGYLLNGAVQDDVGSHPAPS